MAYDPPTAMTGTTMVTPASITQLTEPIWAGGGGGASAPHFPPPPPGVSHVFPFTVDTPLVSAETEADPVFRAIRGALEKEGAQYPTRLALAAYAAVWDAGSLLLEARRARALADAASEQPPRHRRKAR